MFCTRLYAGRYLLVSSGRPLSSLRKKDLHTSLVNSSQDEEGLGYPLPWPHYSKAFASREPLMHRMSGLFIVKRVANILSHLFSVSEFLLGVREAVYMFADVIASQERHDELEHILEPNLCSSVRQTLSLLPENAHIHLDIESIRNLQLVAVNAIIGSADPGDEHVIAYLGHKVITSQMRMQSLIDQDTKFTFNSARAIGKEATVSRLEFQLGVSFSTKEKFAVLDESGTVVKGSNQFKDCFHYWKFNSLVPWETEEYPFRWTVMDINNFLHSCK